MRNDGRKSGSADSHMENEDKKRVKDQVQDSTDGDGEHSGHSKSLGVDKVVHAKTDHDKKRADKVETDVCICIRISNITGAEQVKQWALGQVAQNHENAAGNQEHGKGVAENFPSAPRFTGTSCHRKKRCAAHTEQIGKSGDDCNDRQSQTDSGQRLGGHVWEMTDVNAVNNVVKDINELRKRHRNCKTQNISRDAALTKVMSVRRFCFW